jgi:hypothetical protein
MADKLVTIVFLAIVSLSGLAVTAVSSAGRPGVAGPTLAQRL